MSAVHNSVETVNAAATAIVTAESRVQPTTAQKKRWGSCWSLYWCFGSYKPKKHKRIGHAVLVPEPALAGNAAPATESLHWSSTIVLPFIAPPSSPVSFFQSDPPSASQSPAGLVSLTSLSVNAYSPPDPASIFAIGPYAHETQLVSPPAFSTFTTEPSTASFTPPPEPVQLTTPPSPEVPFAQLLTSTLGGATKNSGIKQKFSLSQYEFLPYQLCQGSPVGHLISPSSAVSNSGTSSPLPNNASIVQFCMAEVPELLGFEHFSNLKWGSRLGSGSMTPDGVEPVSHDSLLLENQLYEVASLANSSCESQNEDIVIDHRVSFELTGEGAQCYPGKYLMSSAKNVPESLPDIADTDSTRGEAILNKTGHFCEYCVGRALSNMPNKASGEEEDDCPQKHRSVSLESIKEFNFDNKKGEALDKPIVNSEWWADEKVIGKELELRDNWTFFPILQPGVI